MLQETGVWMYRIAVATMYTLPRLRGPSVLFRLGFFCEIALGSFFLKPRLSKDFKWWFVITSC